MNKVLWILLFFLFLTLIPETSAKQGINREVLTIEGSKEQPWRIIPISEMESLIVGVSSNAYPIEEPHQKRLFLMILNNSQIIQKKILPYYGEIHTGDAMIDRNGDILIVTTVEHQYSYNILVLKLDKGLNEIWNISLGGSYFEIAGNIFQSHNGSYYITGKKNGSHSGSDVWLINVAENGTELWNITIDYETNDFNCYGMQSTIGDLIIVSSSYGMGIEKETLYVTSLTYNGTLNWNISFRETESVHLDSPIIALSNGSFLLCVNKVTSHSNACQVRHYFIDLNGTILKEIVIGDHGYSIQIIPGFSGGYITLATWYRHSVKEPFSVAFVNEKFNLEWNFSIGFRISHPSLAYYENKISLIFLSGKTQDSGFDIELITLDTVDSDNDGYLDFLDSFPNNPNEWSDTDNDGVGDNADEFPNNPDEWKDSDGDGVGDNADPIPWSPLISRWWEIVIMVVVSISIAATILRYRRMKK